MSDKKGIPLRNDKALELFEEHQKKGKCWCPWCQKARSLKRTLPLERQLK